MHPEVDQDHVPVHVQGDVDPVVDPAIEALLKESDFMLLIWVIINIKLGWPMMYKIY